MRRGNRARHNIYSPSIHLSVECEHDEISFFMVADSFIIGEVPHEEGVMMRGMYLPDRTKRNPENSSEGVTSKMSTSERCSFTNGRQGEKIGKKSVKTSEMR